MRFQSSSITNAVPTGSQNSSGWLSARGSHSILPSMRLQARHENVNLHYLSDADAEAANILTNMIDEEETHNIDISMAQGSLHPVMNILVSRSSAASQAVRAGIARQKKFFRVAFGNPEKALSALSFQFFLNSALSSSLEPFWTKKYVVSESSETTYLRGLCWSE